MEAIYQIYLDTFFLIHVIYLFCMLELTTTILQCTVTHRRMIKGALLGAALYCMIILIPGNWIIVKVLAGYLFVNLILFIYTYRVHTIRQIYRIALIMYGAVTLAGGTLSLVIKYIPFQDKWMLVQMVFLFAFTFATKRMIQNYFKRRNTGLIPVSVSVNQHSFSTMAFLDSGNGLYEPISGKPVSIIEKALLPKEQVLLQEKYKAIPFHAVGTQNGMLDGYEADYITIEMEGETISIFKPIIAITPNNVTTGKKYRMILHPDLLKESEEKE